VLRPFELKRIGASFPVRSIASVEFLLSRVSSEELSGLTITTARRGVGPVRVRVSDSMDKEIMADSAGSGPNWQ
jgi:hypothetical protein